jgi:hypothetical protein
LRSPWKAVWWTRAGDAGKRLEAIAPESAVSFVPRGRTGIDEARKVPSLAATAAGFPASETERPGKVTRSLGSTETSSTPRPTTASVQSLRVGAVGNPGSAWSKKPGTMSFDVPSVCASE